MYVRLLQVINNVDGQFVSATPMRGAVLVFIADLMQRWTSDRYKSVVSLKDNTDLDPLIKNITTIHDRLPVIIFSKIQPLATSTSVNHCYLLEQKKVLQKKKGLFPTGLVQLLVWDTNVAAVSFSWDTKNSRRKVK